MQLTVSIIHSFLRYFCPILILAKTHDVAQLIVPHLLEIEKAHCRVISDPALAGMYAIVYRVLFWWRLFLVCLSIPQN